MEVIQDAIAYIKLVSGEELVAEATVYEFQGEDDEESESTLWIKNPLEISYLRHPETGQMMLHLNHWVYPGVVVRNEFPLDYSHILVTQKVTEKLKTLYMSVIQPKTEPMGTQITQESEESNEPQDAIEDLIKNIESSNSTIYIPDSKYTN